MISKKALQGAYGLAIVLLLVGVLSYAAFPLQRPELPFRWLFKGIAGKVLFDHKIHAGDLGYGISCKDCHHDLEGEDTAAAPCAECHERESKDPKMIKYEDSYHRQCGECHEQIEKGPLKEDCAKCHILT
ncbi:MAG: cytochrome c3 family protein [Desulfobacterales bacterium]|nr:cytochrome c3 family protein [Desulfobacterales bacterium]